MHVLNFRMLLCVLLQFLANTVDDFLGNVDTRGGEVSLYVHLEQSIC